MSPRRTTGPSTRKHHESSASGQSELTARGKTEKQSAKKKTALDSRFHRTLRRCEGERKDTSRRWLPPAHFEESRAQAGARARSEMADDYLSRVSLPRNLRRAASAAAIFGAASLMASVARLPVEAPASLFGWCCVRAVSQLLARPIST